VPAHYHKYLIEAQALRQSGDYGQRHTVTVQQAQAQIEHAEDFLALATALLSAADAGTDD